MKETINDSIESDMDILVAEHDKRTLEKLERIQQEIYEHPLYEQLPAKEVTGLYMKAVQLSGFNPTNLFDEPSLENAVDQIKFARYAIALQSIQEWIDGKFRIGRQDEISPEILAKMRKYNLAGTMGHFESFKSSTQESPMADKFNAVVKSPVDKALDEIIPGKVENKGIYDHSCAGEFCTWHGHGRIFGFNQDFPGEVIDDKLVIGNEMKSSLKE